MKPKLILLNGNPGMGKTTLAQRYVDEHPMALNLDIDNIWIMMGQWQASRPHSDKQKLKYAYVLADMHLAEGYDVIVPNLMQTTEQYNVFERIAATHDAIFKEIILLSTCEDAVERCKKRARALGYADGFRPGGVLDTSGRELELMRMYENVVATIALRPNIVKLESVEGDIDSTYQRLVVAISK
ncbi:MAG: AAA family ATPase [Candidatus Saccharimonadales bacterium]